MDDSAILSHAQQNPLYAAILIKNYHIFEEINRIVKPAILICLSQMANMQTYSPDAIKIIHFLFAAIFTFEKNTDCSDPRRMDCIFLKNILDTLKEGEFYQAYLKFTSGMQISHQMHSLYARGGGRHHGGGRRISLMYIILIILSMLANAGAIQINSANKYARQIVQDFSIYAEEYDMKTADPQTYFNLYFSKIATYYNKYGSCVYQSLALGASPKHINELHHNVYDKYGTKESVMPALTNDIASFFINSFTISIKDKVIDDALYHVRKHGHAIYNSLNTTYHDASIVGRDMEYFEKFVKAPDELNNIYYLYINGPWELYETEIDAYKTKLRNAELESIKNKLHLPDVMGEKLFDVFSPESIIITIPTHIMGHMFTILYNTKNEKVGVYDYNGYIKFKQDNNIQHTQGVFNNNARPEPEPEFSIMNLLFGRPTTLPMSQPFPMYILEPGFWENTNFDSEIDSILNTVSLPIDFNIESIMQYSDNPITTYISIYKNVINKNLGFGGKFVNSMTSEMGMTSFTHINDKFNKFHNLHGNVFQGWGCMTLNNCAESAIAFIETYTNLLERNIYSYYNYEDYNEQQKEDAKKDVSINREYAAQQKQELANYLKSPRIPLKGGKRSYRRHRKHKSRRARRKHRYAISARFVNRRYRNK